MVKVMNKKITIVLATIIVLIIAVLYRFIDTKNAEKAQSEAIQASMTVDVEVMNPFDVETSSVIEAPGRVVAVKSADVIARVQGMILKQHYKDGDFVKQGQLLFTIDPEEFQIAYDLAKANLENAKANQYQAQKDFERTKELVEKDFVSKSEYDNALAAKDAANAQVSASLAQLNDAKRRLSYSKVTAPISGKISLPTVTVGNYLSSPNTMLTTIVSIDPIYVTYSLDSGMFDRLKEDEIIPSGKSKEPIKVSITLPDGSVYNETGNADFFDNVIDQSTGAITMRATFKNPNARLIPGDFVNVKVYSNRVLTSLAVPQSAVLQDSNGRYLYIVNEDNTASKRYIETSGQKDNNWLISSGITKDEKFVSSGVIGVRDGSKVRITNAEDNKVIGGADEATDIKIKDENNEE